MAEFMWYSLAASVLVAAFVGLVYHLWNTRPVRVWWFLASNGVTGPYQAMLLRANLPNCGNGTHTRTRMKLDDALNYYSR